MSDDAEWIDICQGCDTVRPARPRPPTTTRRPFWATVPPATLPPRPSTAWPPRYPYTSPRTVHEGEERALPPPLEPSYTNAAIYGSLGAVLLLALFSLLVYLLVLRRKLSKVEVNRGHQDYSIRVEDVAHLSSPIDDSSQLYVNTSDLHKLVSSVKGNIKQPSAPPTSPPVRGRAKCPVPGEEIGNVPEPPRPKKSFNALKRISNRLNALGFNLLNSLKISKKEISHELNSGYNSSIPDVVKVGVPEVLYDDDLWSEDSFDSCSIGYENEISTQPPNRNSTRESAHRKQKGSFKQKKIYPPCVPPPPPPASKPSAISNAGDIPTPLGDGAGRSLVATRKAPAVPPAVDELEGRSPLYGNITASVSHTAIQVPQVIPPALPLGETSHDSLKTKYDSMNYNSKLPDPIKNNSPKHGLIAAQGIKKPLLPPNHPSKQQDISSTHSNAITQPVRKIPSNDASSTRNVKATHDTKMHTDDSSSVSKNKPLPPTTPKPSNTFNPLPKHKLNLMTPEGTRSCGATPDTATTVVFGTPSEDCPLVESRRPFLPPASQESKENQIDNFEPSSLPVSARRALMESKARSGSSIP